MARSLGRLAIVGLGPGASELWTEETRAELGQAEVVVGYQAYLDLIPASHAPGERIGYDLGDERLRARRAVAEAAEGRRVALVSSGDAGVYGMASLALDEVAALPAPDQPQVRVLPGISAALAAAALIGAPLAVDFACLSLSDLLLPWAELESKLVALAAADITLVIYNPASTRRRAPWENAVRIIGEARDPATPVAVVSRAYRPGQVVHLADVARLDRLWVDMETLVIVGSSRTRRVGDWLVALRDEAGRERSLRPGSGSA